jgi:uncharacterized protein YgiM (DUF1202 family)
MKFLTLLTLLLTLLTACSPYVQTPAAVIPTDTAQATATVAASKTATVAPSAQVTAFQSLNIRVRPGEREAVAGYLYNGNIVTLTGRCSEGWAQIEWQGRTAWVNAKYLSDNKCKE